MNRFTLIHVWTRVTRSCVVIIDTLEWLIYGCCSMIDIIPYGDNPYVIPTIHVIIIHRLFFSCNSLHSFVSPLYLQGCYLSLGCGVAHNSFLSYRGEPRRMLYQIRKMGHFEKPLKTHHIITTNNHRLETSIHWNNWYMVLLLGGMVLYLHLVACLIW